MKIDRLNELLRQGQALDKSLRELIKQQIDGASDPWPAFAKLVGDWLKECVEQGRLLATGSAERRALQGQVNYWTTRLRQADHPRDDIELLTDFDPAAGEPLADDQFPYFGLAAVTAEFRFFGDAVTPRFLGRDEQSGEYADHLSEDENRALLIESESGGGKSSVAMAGVIPALMAKHPDWLFAPRMTPGAEPMQALQEALTAALGPEWPAAPTAEEAAHVLGQRRLLLFVDQLEELLTVCVDAQAQQQFSEWLAALAKAGPLRLLATMRSDHHDRLANSVTCRALYLLLTTNNSARLLPPLSFEQLRQVILRPAQAVGLRFYPPTLVDRLANETANLPGGLPRLQFALRRLWNLRPPRDEPGQPQQAQSRLDLIDQGAFDLLPSVSEALGTVAEQLLAKLSETEKRAVERLTLELTVLDEKSEAPLRRRRLQQELVTVLEKAKLVNPAQARALIDTFVAAGLLVRTGEGNACQVEVAHESLFRHWDDFQDWIKTDKARGRLKQVREITRDAVEWQTHGRKPDYLRLTGEPLDRAVEFAAEGWLDDASQRYCVACAEARQRQIEADALAATLKGKVLQQQLDAETQANDLKQRERKRKIQLKQGAGVLVVVALLAGAVVYFKQDSNRLKLLAANTQLVTLLGQLEPLEALNLVFTLEKNAPGKFMGPLAHAVDRLQGSSMLGEPLEPMDFTFSGSALVQRLSTVKDKSSPAKIDLWPLNQDGSGWTNKVSIGLPLDNPDDPKAERLASIDVSQRLLPEAGKGSQPDRRLVLATFFKAPGTGQGPKVVTKATLYEILSSSAEARKLGDHVFVPASQPTELSEASFGDSGQVIFSALRYPTAQGQSPASELLLLKQDGNGGLAVATQKVAGSEQENQKVVSAVAQRDDGNWVTGRLDGTIYCGNNLFLRADRSPIASLKVAGPWFVGLHQSGQLVAGNCDEPSKPLMSLRERKTGADRPQSLALRSDGNDYRLSFVSGRRLCEVVWERSKWPSPDDLKKSCWATGLDADQVVPAFGAANAPDGIRFLALPDRSRPRLVALAGDPLTPARDATPVRSDGLPVGRPADQSAQDAAGKAVPGRPAAAGQVSAGIRFSGQLFSVWRKVGAGNEDTLKLDRVEPGFQPNAVAVNAMGSVAVLGSNGQLAFFPPVPGTLQLADKLSFRPVCLAMSAGGNQLLASGGTGGRWRSPLDTGKLSSIGLSEDGKPGVALDACAVADDGTTVSGFQDGRVEVFPPVQGKTATELNPLLRYRLAGGVQALSVDASGRFVAALGKPSQKSCPASLGGRPLNIWDRNQKSSLPVASTCLTGRQIASIGPLREVNRRWELDVFEFDAADAKSPVKKSPYICLACGLAAVDLKDPGSSELAKRALGFKPIELKREALKRAYGIEL